jgi:hypothetical protein
MKMTDSELEKFIEQYKKTICQSLLGKDKGEKVSSLVFDDKEKDENKMILFDILYQNSVIDNVKITLKIDYKNLKNDIKNCRPNWQYANVA